MASHIKIDKETEDLIKEARKKIYKDGTTDRQIVEEALRLLQQTIDLKKKK